MTLAAVASTPPVDGMAARLRISEEFMRADLAKSGLAPEDIESAPHAYRPDDTWSMRINGRESSFAVGKFVTACYRIPYFEQDTGKKLTKSFGVLLMYRERRQLDKSTPIEFDGKYHQPSKNIAGEWASYPYFPPARLALLGTKIYDIHEGEKKAACAIKHAHQHAIGIGGCHQGRRGVIELQLAIEADIHRAYLASGCASPVEFTIRLWPDGDLTKWSVQIGWGALARAISDLGYTVRIANLAAKWGEAAKFDDLIVEHGTAAVLESIELINVNELALSAREIMARFGGLLMHRPTEGTPYPKALDFNFTLLIKEHPTFASKFWFNADIGKPMFGNEQIVESVTEVEVLHFFQNQLGFNRNGSNGNIARLPAIRTAMGHAIHSNEISPFRDYIDSLRWDGVSRLNTWVSRICKVPASTFSSEAGKRWMIAAVARLFEPGCIVRFMLIMQGPQGIGKSSLPDALWGSHLVAMYTHSVKDKDAQMLFHSGLCVNYDELSAMRGQELSYLKSEISLTKDNFRPPYGREMGDHPRRCVLYGSVNDEHVLEFDSTGMGRPVILRAGGKFDFAALSAERDQLWAEAKSLYENGAEYSEVPGATENALEFVKSSALVDQLSELFMTAGFKWDELPTRPEDVGITTHRVMKALNIPLTAMAQQHQIGAAMRQLGFKQIRTPKGKGHVWVLPKSNVGGL